LPSNYPQLTCSLASTSSHELFAARAHGPVLGNPPRSTVLPKYFPLAVGITFPHRPSSARSQRYPRTNQTHKVRDRSIAKTSVLMSVEYPRQLVIYDAGDIRSTFVSFWKATAIFQFGCTCVFLAPLLYKNENQPDKDIRFLQTVGGKNCLSISCMPFLLRCLSFEYSCSHFAPNVRLYCNTQNLHTQ
jgi:hypothetical protein